VITIDKANPRSRKYVAGSDRVGRSGGGWWSTTSPAIASRTRCGFLSEESAPRSRPPNPAHHASERLAAAGCSDEVTFITVVRDQRESPGWADPDQLDKKRRLCIQVGRCADGGPICGAEQPGGFVPAHADRAAARSRRIRAQAAEGAESGPNDDRRRTVIVAEAIRPRAGPRRPGRRAHPAVRGYGRTTILRVLPLVREYEKRAMMKSNDTRFLLGGSDSPSVFSKLVRQAEARGVGYAPGCARLPRRINSERGRSEIASPLLK